LHWLANTIATGAALVALDPHFDPFQAPFNPVVSVADAFGRVFVSWSDTFYMAAKSWRAGTMLALAHIFSPLMSYLTIFGAAKLSSVTNSRQRIFFY